MRVVLETLARTYGSRMRQLRPRELELWREMLEVEYRKMNRLDNDNADDEGTGWLHHGAPPGEGEPQLDKEADMHRPAMQRYQWRRHTLTQARTWPRVTCSTQYNNHCRASRLKIPT